MQGLRRETELEGLYTMAQTGRNGWMPTQHLTVARALRSWFLENCKSVPANVCSMAQHLREQLPQLSKPEGRPQLMRVTIFFLGGTDRAHICAPHISPLLHASTKKHGGAICW